MSRTPTFLLHCFNSQSTKANSYPANIVLQDTIERLYAENLYADIPRGVFLVRGENVLLLGEIVRLCSCEDTILQPLIVSSITGP